MAKKIEEILQSITSLKPMPANVASILREVDKPDVTIDKLAGMISLDQALAAMVLQMSNSAALGFSRTCSTLYEAIMHIGLTRLKSILLVSNASGMMQRRLSGYRLGEGELWHHSLVVAAAAEWLARTLHYRNPEEAYVSGLLHDIGKLILDQYVISYHDRIAEAVRDRQVELWRAEEELIGIDHASAGGRIAQRWNFPVTLVDAIHFHHAPSFARADQKLPAIVNLANHFAADYQQGRTDFFSFQLHPESLNIMKIDAARIKELRAGMQTSGLFPNYSMSEAAQ